ncbi:hypothetical protein JTM36_36560, partial [Pseudomonas aeruginosa]|nr:hypothetical protein [Pseudomonas aeruginosa]
HSFRCCVVSYLPDRGFHPRTRALAFLRLDHATPDSAPNSITLGAQARDGYWAQIEANREAEVAGFNTFGVQPLNCEIEAAAQCTC